MKTKSYARTILILSMSLAATSALAEDGFAYRYKGETQFTIAVATRDGQEAVQDKLSTQLTVNSWGDGKVKVIFLVDDFVERIKLPHSIGKDRFKCAGTQSMYVGYMGATDDYALYPSSLTQDATPSNSQVVGELTLIGNTAILHLKGGFSAQAGPVCSVNVLEDVAIQMKRTGGRSERDSEE